MPRLTKASRSSTSTCAFTLRNSAAAARSSAVYKAGSTRIGNAFLGGGGISSTGALRIKRAGIDHGLGIALTAQHNHQV
jgi:hypothetical protein